MNTFPEQREQEKYDDLYLRTNYSKTLTSRVSEAYVWCRNRCLYTNPKIIDLGCGGGVLLELLTEYESYLGVDIAMEWMGKLQETRTTTNINFEFGNLTQLPYPNDYFDFGFCFDVMEHIPPEFVDQVITEQKRVCRNLCLCICTVPHKQHAEIELHLTVRSANWWLEKYEPVDSFTNEAHVYIVQGPDTMPQVHDPFLEFRPINGLRFPADGTIQMLRNNKQLERRLTQDFEKIPGQLKWRPKISEQFDVTHLTNAHKDQQCYIVGKGPSLDDLTAEDFEDPEAPVMAINEAYLKVDSLPISNPVYLIQHDSAVDVKPIRATLILQRELENKYPTCAGRRFLFTQNHTEVSMNLTVLHAMRIATRIMGCNELELLCFDGCVNGDTRYAKIVGYVPKPTPQGSPEEGYAGERFLKHRPIIEAHADVPITFRLPQSGVASSDKPQPLRDNLAEHREHVQASRQDAYKASSDSPLKTEASPPAWPQGHSDTGRPT